MAKKKPDTNLIQSVKDYMDKVSIYIKSVTVDGYKPRLLFRGQENKDWEVESGFYRVKKDELISKSDSQINRIMIDYHKQYLSEIHKRETTHLPLKNMSKLSIIAEAQHLGGKTAIIDFTENPLVALYFACKQTTKKGSIARIFVLDTETEWINYKMISGKDSEDKGVEQFKLNQNSFSKNTQSPKELKDDTIYQWMPPIENTRILKQDSVFILLSTGKLDKSFINKTFDIDKKRKQSILKELDVLYNISERTLFPDFFGYIGNNDLYKPTTSDDIKAYYREALQLYRMEAYSDAEEQISAAIALIANNKIKGIFDSKIYNLYGNILSANKKPIDAIFKYIQAIEINGKNAYFHSNLAERYEVLMNFDEAIKHYKEAEKIILSNKDSTSTQHQYLLNILRSIADLSSINGNIIEASEYYLKISNLAPDDIVVEITKLWIDILINPDKDISRELDVIEQKLGDNADAYNAFGILFIAKKEYDKALQFINKSIELNDSNYGYWINKGVAYQKLEKGIDALNCYQKAYELNPHVLITIILVTQQYFNLNMPHNAEVVYRNGLKDFPNNPNILLGLGKSLGWQNKYNEEAIQVFEEAYRYSELVPHIRRDINFERVYLYIALENTQKATMYLNEIEQRGDNDEQIKEEITKLRTDISKIENVKSIFPPNRDIQASLTEKETTLIAKAFEEEKIGNLSGAIYIYSEIISENGSLPIVYYNRGCLLFKFNNYVESIKDYDKAIELQYDYPEAHCNRAVAYTTFITNDNTLTYKEKIKFLTKVYGQIIETIQIAEKMRSAEALQKSNNLSRIVSQEIERLKLLEKLSE
ncbi:FRG domain-containing protein [Dysgonomonas sp. ZJ279]|uniref:FRG domain-containing protein n=1 Tax=Dysgonomonas sp. ZJ279 TaxID=2709796 RepID=UPI0013EC47F7|nr:FRG domain-containing protein [Dysgonomonas sp. ZJ279]